jgi:hypothetical protein
VETTRPGTQNSDEVGQLWVLGMWNQRQRSEHVDDADITPSKEYSSMELNYIGIITAHRGKHVNSNRMIDVISFDGRTRRIPCTVHAYTECMLPSSEEYISSIL